MNLSTLEEAVYSCCRLLAKGQEDSWVASGFFVKITTSDGLQSDLLLTCKHVVSEAVSISFYVRRRVGDNPFRNPVVSAIDIDVSKCVMLDHPSEDLCAIFVHPYMKAWDARDGAWPFIYAFGLSHICEPEDLDALEEFVMIGCPSGIYDDVNYNPILRRGVTASHPGFRYKGNKQFLVDCASHAGSSGSPIIRYSSLFFDRKKGSYDLAMHPRIALLGMLTSGLDDSIEGGQHLDLGVAVSAEAIAELMEMATQFLTNLSPLDNQH